MRSEDGYFISKCLDGDSAAFGFLVDKYRESLYALAYDRVGNFHDAEDIAQEAFIKAYQNLRQLRYWDSFASWLCRITSNLCKNWIRTGSRRPDSESMPDGVPEVLQKLSSESHSEKVVYESLHEAIDALPEIYRQVIHFHYMAGMATKEIATFIHISPAAVRKRLSTARKMLRAELLPALDTAFDDQNVRAGFTLNIVDSIKRLKIQPASPNTNLPWRISLGVGIILFALGLISNQLMLSGYLDPAGAPILAEVEVLRTGEIPVDILVTPDMSIISGNRADGAGGGPELIILAGDETNTNFLQKEEEINIAVRLRAYEEGWNQGNLNIIDEIYSDDFVGNMPPFDTKESVRMAFAAYRAAVPDIHATVEDIIAQGDLVATRYTIAGTQQGELMGIPPTGRYGTTLGISIARMVDGKAAQVWENNDFLGMMEQLGVIPATREVYVWGEPSPIAGAPGAPEGNISISRRSIEEIWMLGNTDVVDELYHAEYLRHEPASPGIDSAEAFKMMIIGFHAAFSNVEFVIQEHFAQGDRVVSLSQLSATHTADYGAFPATGNIISTPVISIHRMADGRIAESWVAKDTLDLVEQLTAEPEPAPEPDLEGALRD